MKKIMLAVLMIILFYSDYSFAQTDINDYVDKQLESLNIDSIQKYLDESEVLGDLDLKTFLKEVITGDKNLLDIFDKESIKFLFFKEVKTSMKICAMVLVLSLLSSILKSLENSFSSGTITQITNYIIFITMISFILVAFKDVLEIADSSINSIIGLVKVIVPVLLTLLALMGLPITSSVLNPIFIGGITFINILFKKFLFVSISLAFSILVVNNLSKSIKLSKLASFIKNINFLCIGAMFTVYLGLVSVQGLYVTSLDSFTMKTTKFAVGSFIPVVGGFVSDSLDIILSSSQLIKGVFGSIGLIILVAISITPVIKIFSIILVYKICSIVVEPVGEERISTFLNEVANLMIVILSCVIAITIMFFVTVGILTSMGVISS